MENIIALIVMAASLAVAGVMVTRNLRSDVSAGGKAKAAPALLSVSALLLFCDTAAGKGVLLRIPFDLLLSVLAAFSLNSSVVPLRGGRTVAVSVCLSEICISVYYLLCAYDCLPLPSVIAAVSASAAVSVCTSAVFLYGISCRIWNISALMVSGNAWDWLCLGSDAVCVIILLAETVAMILAFSASDSGGSPVMLIFPVLFGAGHIALCIRLFSGSAFVIAGRHEMRISGALKTPKEMAGARLSSVDRTYREIYSRIVLYFEEKKPYLNGDLTINDIVKGVYTNKLYISKAISQCAGKNFCQFVNYYRVMHSVDIYRQNPEMRVADMWQSSGFNSIVSYNMAFKLFMGENPSDWCRKEKARLVKCKK